MCPVIIDGKKCLKCVLDLSTHLTRFHNLTSSCPEYDAAIKSSLCIQRKVFYKDCSNIKANPLSNDGSAVPCKFSKSSLDKPISNSTLTNNANTSHSNSSLSDFSQCEPEIYGDTIPEFALNQIPPGCINMLSSFKRHLSSVSGGSRSPAFIQKDNFNMHSLLSSLGDEKLFCPLSLNTYITREKQLGKSPSTMLSRILTLRRFIDYLKIYKHSLLPTTENLESLVSMMKGLETSIINQKSKRQQSIMTSNRKRFPHTVEVLREWREKRTTDNCLDVFQSHKKIRILI